MSTIPPYIRLESQSLSLLLNCQGRTPALLYFGKKLREATTAQMLSLLSTRQEAKCSVVIEAPISLTPLNAEGFTGAPGLELSNEQQAWSVGPKLIEVKQLSAHAVKFVSVDELRGIELIHQLELDDQSNVLHASTQLRNLNDLPLQLHWCAAPTFLLPDHLTQLTSFEGRWSNEFQRRSIDLFLGSFLRENRKGKTSHDNFPGVLVHGHNTSEQQGECYGFHLGWSGNHRSRVELLAEGRSYLQMGELLLPGEVTLQAGESYQSPTLYASWSGEGFSALSRNFHSFVRNRLLSKAQRQKPRPVHYNTWEGIYFQHDVATLKTLADEVAVLGVERFVLDDGWFKGRRGDFAGLGDWTVDSAVYPEGLSPLIDYVDSLGMEFGLWFEPEMVNPDSDLFRAHPDWVLQTEGNAQLKFRNQLVLDLSRKDVSDYLFNAIDAILRQYPLIRYIKWDINRDLNHPGNYLAKPAVHNQTLSLYSLVNRIKDAHPGLEIESCSSGGARVDYGVLAYTDRVWTSDSNDALDRLQIQRGCSFFFPSNVMGAHVGPRDCHITGRRVTLEMRAAVAMFGHMGIEMDPRELTIPEKEALTSAITLHKKHRDFIHSADLYRLDSDGDVISFGFVDKDKTKALFTYNLVRETARTLPARYRFVGLDINRHYRITLVWPTQLKEYSPSILKLIQGEILSAEALMHFGMQLPIVHPQTSLIFELLAM
jgi:alpha-galactosidase